jgi:hypothetical protein
MYPSKYSNGKTVSAAQYITELICEHKAKIDKLDLHYKFWTHKKWSMFFKNQIASANKLLKKYSSTAIIRALSDSKAQKIYSLRAPHLIAIIEHYEKLIEQEHNRCTKIQIDRSADKTFRVNPNDKTKTNIINKLEDIDNNEN